MGALLGLPPALDVLNEADRRYMVLKVKTVGWLLLAWIAAVGIPCGSTAQAADTLALVGSLNFSSGSGSEVWGWTAPDNTEYGIMGYRNGIAFIRTTPTIQLIDTVPGPVGNNGYPWREMKTYLHYAYIVSEATGAFSGITVVDLQWLPDSVHYVGSFPTDTLTGGSNFTAHTISIDTVGGWCYVEGTSARQVRILSLANPEAPTFVHAFGTASSSIHDMTAYGDTVYVAEGSMGTWSVWNVAVKTAPVMIVRVSIPASGYVHNVWLSPDHQYCATTEETAGKTVKIWDISDLGNVTLIGNYLGPSGMAHNAHWLTQDTLVLSHYQSGLVVLDMSNPASPVQIGKYDTYPAGESSAFQGCWGAYPYTQNGYIYGSNIGGGFFVVQMQSTCQTLSGPALHEPNDGAQNLIQPITLTWGNNAAINYRVEVDSDPGFGSPDRDTVITDTTLAISGLPMGATYHWRVHSENACGFGSPSPSRSFEAGCVVVMTGDVNESSSITSADIVLLVNYVFKGGADPEPIPEAGDTDCSGAVSSADVIRLVNFVFKSGIPPCDVCTIL